MTTRIYKHLTKTDCERVKPNRREAQTDDQSNEPRVSFGLIVRNSVWASSDTSTNLGRSAKCCGDCATVEVFMLRLFLTLALFFSYSFLAGAFAQDSQGTGAPVVSEGSQASLPNTSPLDLSMLDEASRTREPALPAGKKETEGASVVPVGSGNIPARVSGTEPSPDRVSENRPVSAPDTPGKSSRTSVTTVWDLVAAGGWIGVVIFILSLFACMRVVQFFIAFRRVELMPPEVCREVSQLIETGRLRQAIQSCDDDGSAYARIVSAALGQAEGGWGAVEQAAQDALTEEAASMYRRVELLSVVGNIAPMLGLLGTVLGMVIAFGELATSDGLAKNLAQGIYFALVTTVDGLLVAIPALLAFSFFNNRVAALSTELTHRVEGTLRPLRRGTQSSPAPRGPIPGVKISGLQELK